MRGGPLAARVDILDPEEEFLEPGTRLLCGAQCTQLGGAGLEGQAGLDDLRKILQGRLEDPGRPVAVLGQQAMFDQYADRLAHRSPRYPERMGQLLFGDDVPCLE